MGVFAFLRPAVGEEVSEGFRKRPAGHFGHAVEAFHLRLWRVLVVSVSGTILVSTLTAGLAKDKKAVVIIVDGIPKDVIERLHVPVIYDIAKDGAFGASFVGGEVGMYNQTPTISAVGYNTMLTGVWVNKRFKEGKASMVDINPTVCEFLGMEIPEQVAWERDGIPFIGKNEISDLEVTTYDREVTLSWRAWDKAATVSVYACPENEYKTSGKESWIPLGTLKAGEGKFSYDLDKIGKSKLYKFVVAGKQESLNRWLVM